MKKIITTKLKNEIVKIIEESEILNFKEFVAADNTFECEWTEYAEMIDIVIMPDMEMLVIFYNWLGDDNTINIYNFVIDKIADPFGYHCEHIFE